MSRWGDVFLEHWNAVLGLRRVLFWLLFFSPCTRQTSGTTQSPATYKSILMIRLLMIRMCARRTGEGVQVTCGVLLWLNQKELFAPEHYQDQRAGGGFQDI